MAEDIVTKIKELKNLPPEERIKRLKEIEEMNRKEIEEAHKLIQESEVEIEEQEKEKEQIPIPQVRAADIDMLVGEEERRVFATKRYVDVRRKADEETEPVERKTLTIDKNLEDTIFGESSIRLSPSQLEEHKQYQIRLATQVTSKDLYNMAVQAAGEVKQKLDERGYLSNQQMQEFETKFRDIAYAAVYKGPTADELAQKTLTLTGTMMKYTRG